MTRARVEHAPGCFVDPSDKVDQAWAAYRKHVLSKRDDEAAWEAERDRLHRLFMEAFEE